MAKCFSLGMKTSFCARINLINALFRGDASCQVTLTVDRDSKFQFERLRSSLNLDERSVPTRIPGEKARVSHSLSFDHPHRPEAGDTFGNAGLIHGLHNIRHVLVGVRHLLSHGAATLVAS